MNAKDMYKEYGAGTSTVEYSHCVDGKLISIREIIEISEHKCQKSTNDEYCKTCSLKGIFP